MKERTQALSHMYNLLYLRNMHSNLLLHRHHLEQIHSHCTSHMSMSSMLDMDLEHIAEQHLQPHVQQGLSAYRCLMDTHP